MEDQDYMRRALDIAVRGEGRVCPNPLVGCVVVKDGRIIGEGWHEQCGGLHAERNALRSCTEDAAGATLYVTLEPCCHWGRTPPCTDAILEHKIARVVVGCVDPNPQVAGCGIGILREHGVEVQVGLLGKDCLALNEVFFHYITHKTPFVVMKYAMTLDGKIASHTGDSRWVTGEQARAHVHRMRNRFSAIMVGVGTVLADDPMLTCRADGGRDPVRIVCDSYLRTPPDSRLIRTARQTRTILAAVERGTRAEALEAAGAEVLLCEQRDGRIDLNDLMQKLGAWGIDSILLEGGSMLHFAALSAGIVRKVQAYIAPKLIGGAEAKTPLGGIGFSCMAQAVPVHHMTVTQLGEDFLLEGLL